MKVNMTKKSEGVAVHAVHPVPLRGPVFYASLPCVPSASEKPWEDGEGGEEARHRLVAILWNHREAMTNPAWNRSQSPAAAPLPFKLVRGLLGRPQLQSGAHRAPAVSFSEGGGRVWAALCGDDSDIGIDLAAADEFQGNYPLHRVFHPEELHHALKLANGDVAAAAALLWSVKEAVVKALGCGFHLVDPRQITVHPFASDCGGQTFTADLSGKARARYPLASGSSLRVHALPQGKMWFSIALFNKRLTVHG